MAAITPQQIQELRDAFLSELNGKGEGAIHPNDLKRVKSDDQWLQRFLMHHEADQKLALQMMWEVMEWRKSIGANDLNESTIRMDYMVEGGFFTRGRDKDGAALFILKCKKHIKGTKDMEDLKKCVVYWLERLERQEKGKPITIFFDMEGCGLSNMDMEYTKYLINLFKQYYPYFLNYIIIYEMAWILNAAFKVIKSWLPEKAVQKIKMLKKADLFTYVPADQALTCWGGQDDYVFSFVSETAPAPHQSMANDVTNTSSSRAKQVHFEDASPLSESSPVNMSSGMDKDCVEGEVLTVYPPGGVINFVKDVDEYVSTFDLHNTDQRAKISYKMKTTAPEKFRVRPSAGVLGPGDRAKITVTLLPAYQISGLAKDKFLIMSLPVETVHMSPTELSDLWKNTAGKHVTSHRLRCAQSGGPQDSIQRNGGVSHSSSSSHSSDQLSKLSTTVAQLKEHQRSLQASVRRTEILQLATVCLVAVVALLCFVMWRSSAQQIGKYSMADGCTGERDL